jgi:hypothetical protein
MHKLKRNGTTYYLIAPKGQAVSTFVPDQPEQSFNVPTEVATPFVTRLGKFYTCVTYLFLTVL